VNTGINRSGTALPGNHGRGYDFSELDITGSSGDIPHPCGTVLTSSVRSSSITTRARFRSSGPITSSCDLWSSSIPKRSFKL
jgi:hypothetical protein